MRRGRIARAASGIVVAIAALILAACAGAAPESMPAPAPTSDFARLLQGYLENAEQQGLGDAQIALLREAEKTGVISFEEYRSAVDNALDCIRTAGYRVIEDPVDESRGFPFINYSYESPAAGNPVAEACVNEYSAAIEGLYQMQPSSIEGQDKVFMDRVPEVVACLERVGVEWETEGKTVDELKQSLLQLLNDEDLPTDGSEPPVHSCVMFGF